MDLSGMRVGRSVMEEPLTVSEARALTQADVLTLDQGRGHGKGEIARQQLTKVTQRHHGLARLLAAGTTGRDAALIMGYTQVTVSILQEDPTFADLVRFYAEDVDAAYQSMNAQLAGVGQDALTELQRRIEETPEELGAVFLLDVVIKTADRTGNGPASKTTSEVNVNFGIAEKMAAARKRVAEATGQLTIDARANPPGDVE